MKRIVLLVSLLLPMVAYAQTDAKSSMETPPPNSSDSSNIASGVVTDLTAETITVKTNAPNQMSFAIRKGVQFVDSKGRKVKKQRIAPGTRVRVYYYGNEDTRTASRIALEGQ